MSSHFQWRACFTASNSLRVLSIASCTQSTHWLSSMTIASQTKKTGTVESFVCHRLSVSCRVVRFAACNVPPAKSRSPQAARLQEETMPPAARQRLAQFEPAAVSNVCRRILCYIQKPAHVAKFVKARCGPRHTFVNRSACILLLGRASANAVVACVKQIFHREMPIEPSKVGCVHLPCRAVNFVPQEHPVVGVLPVFLYPCMLASTPASRRIVQHNSSAHVHVLEHLLRVPLNAWRGCQCYVASRLQRRTDNGIELQIDL